MTKEALPLARIEGPNSFHAEQYLDAIRVNNAVEWVNPDINLPLGLVVGQPTELAVMVAPGSEANGETKVLGLFDHRRSVLIGRTVFTDKQGVTYRDIDSKGSGYVDTPPGSRELQGFGADGQDYLGTRGRGLLEKGDANLDQAYGEILSAAGVRVARAVAIIGLKELIDEHGQKISLDEARDRTLIGADFEPVIELRAFGTRARIGDGENYIPDAMTLVAEERGRDPKGFGPKAYILWYARTLGEQIRKVHEMGFTHTNLHHQNLTMDCRLVDFDDVSPIPSDNDERAQVIDNEAVRNWWVVANDLRKGLAKVFPEIGVGEPTREDDLTRAIKSAYEKGYGELTDEFVYGQPPD